MSPQAKTLVGLLALTAVAGGIGLYAYYGVDQKDRADEAKKDRDLRLFAPQRADEKNPDGGTVTVDFVRVEVVAEGDTTVVEREPGKPWRLTSPVTTAADPATMDQLVSQLQTAKFKQLVDENPDAAALKTYGLAEPQFVVTATALVGPQREKRSAKLSAGIENTFDGSLFMQREGSPVVYAAEGGAKWALKKRTYDLRQKELAPFEEAQLSRAEVNAKINHYTLARDAEKRWTVTPAVDPKAKKGAPPATELADPMVVNGMIAAMHTEKANAFPDHPPLAVFEKPIQDLTFTTDAGVIRLRIASPTPDAGELYWALREHGDEQLVMQANPTVLQHFERNPLDLADKAVLQFKKEAVVKAVFRLASGSDLVLERAAADAGSADTWRVTAPVQAPAKVFKMASLLWAIAGVKAAKVVDEKPKDLKKYGLDDTARSVTLFGGDGQSLGTMKLGAAVPDKDKVAYLIGTRGQVVEADLTRLSDFPATADDLIDKPAADAGQ